MTWEYHNHRNNQHMLPTERYAEEEHKKRTIKSIMFYLNLIHIIFDQPLNTNKKEYISVLSMLHSVSRKEHIV